ncbi:CAIB/BAIF family protein (plasmid) [Paraburkholderia caribensis MBA4]|uniref:CAIB/BAIF family protein n=1 Tax=Paraburkholderia caribensis MBA4 TaxID=1323664 RepID=A0A0P0RM21_9BURK|nr:CoA transferase [Paraburkholderia caribensis]ALL69918.1 CAIB/BAIF family protein [Paraburkholderia caribensis MBA4]
MNSPFGDIQILDMTYDFGRYVGRLFADLGATVTRVEPPGGLPDRRAVSGDDRLARDACLYEFEFLNASKQSRVIDLESAAGRDAFIALARTADVVLLERGGPLYDEPAWLREQAPAAVITSISPYGRTGPWADAAATDLTLQAAGGIAWLSGRLDDAPLRLPGAQATMIAGVYAATATSLALYDSMATGRAHDVEVSVQECIAHSLQNSVQMWDFEKKVSMRGGEGTRDASEDMFACKDGLIFLAAPRSLGVSWNALVQWVVETGHAAGEELTKDRWADRVWRLSSEAKRILRETLESFTRGYTQEELTREALTRKIVMGPVAKVRDVLDDPQLQHREYFTTLALAHAGGNARFPGAPYRMSEPVWHVRPAAPLDQPQPA